MKRKGENVKITNLSLTAIMALGMMSVANADVDVKVGGQGVIYYQTMDKGGDADLFDHAGNSRANAGLQLNLNADLGKGFGLGYQETFLGSLGLEKNLVGNTMQTAEKDTLNSPVMVRLSINISPLLFISCITALTPPAISISCI